MWTEKNYQSNMSETMYITYPKTYQRKLCLQYLYLYIFADLYSEFNDNTSCIFTTSNL